MLKPEMVEDLYEDLPDMELEKDHNSFRQKQRKRRKRRQHSTLDVEPEQNGTFLQHSNSLVFFLNWGGIDKLSEEAMLLIFNASQQILVLIAAIINGRPVIEVSHTLKHKLCSYAMQDTDTNLICLFLDRF